MTQKEYKELVEQYESKIKELEKELEIEKNKNFNYEECLQKYYFVSERLNEEENYNRLNIEKIEQLNGIIDRYKEMIAKFTINV